MKLKKFVSVLTCFAIGGAMCVPFAGCGESSDTSAVDTYKGEVSDSSYTSEKTAASAFLSEEIASDETSLTYDSYTKQSTLSSDEVDELNLSGIDKSKVESVEKGTVAYTKNADAASEVSLYAAKAYDGETTETNKLTVTVYLVKLDVSEEGSSEKKYEYRYYVPLPQVGEAISKSYYESVFDASKYTNCTATYSATVKTDVPSEYGTMETSVVTSGKMEITATAAHVTMEVKTVMSIPDLPDSYKSIVESMPEAANITVTADYYISKNADGGADVAYSTDGGKTYTKASLSVSFGIDEYDELFSADLSGEVSEAVYSFFEKTDYGFTMSTDMLEEYLDSAIAAVKEELSTELNITISDDNNAKYDFYVSDGRLNKIDYSLLFKITAGSATYGSDMSMTMEYSDFGKTSVTVPDAAKTTLS